MNSQLMAQIENGEVNIDQLLKPEVHLAEIPVDSLKIKVLESGFPSLDEMMLLKDQRSELIIVGGRPSMGKSAFMFQLAFQIAQHSPVHVFSLEMDKEQILTRLIAGKINKSISAIQKGFVDNAILTKERDAFKSLQYYIDDRAGIDIYQVSAAARDAAKRYGTKVIVVDYLQLLRVEKRHSKDDEIGTITKELKALAKDLKATVIVGSQLNRECERRGKDTGDYRPILSDLRESGNVEQDADMVLFVHRQSRYTNERPGEADIIVAKNRNGAVGTIEMTFSETQTRFIDNRSYDL